MKARWGTPLTQRYGFIGLETCKRRSNLKIRIYSQILHVSLSLNLLTFILPKTNHISHVTNHLHCTLPIRKSYKNYSPIKITNQVLTHSTQLSNYLSRIVDDTPIIIFFFRKENDLRKVSLLNGFVYRFQFLSTYRNINFS